MFRLIKQIFISALMYFGNLSSVNSLECVSMKNQECKVRPEIVDINSNNPKVSNLMTLTSETRNIKWYESFKCICRLDKIICNSKQHGMKINVGVKVKN